MSFKEIAIYCVFTACVIAFCFHFIMSKPEYKIPISPADQTRIAKELKDRCAEDCVLTPTEYGWKCTQRDGKIFKIRM